MTSQNIYLSSWDILSAPNGRTIDEWRIEVDLKGTVHDLNQDTIHTCASRKWGKPRDTLIRLVGVPSGILRDPIPNTSLKRYICANLLGIFAAHVMLFQTASVV
jgi:hypothetical protein